MRTEDSFLETQSELINIRIESTLERESLEVVPDPRESVVMYESWSEHQEDTILETILLCS